MNDTQQEVASENNAGDNETTPQNLPSQSIFKMPFKQLLLMAMTSGAIGIALFTISPIVGLLSIIPWEKLGDELSYILKRSIS